MRDKCLHVDLYCRAPDKKQRSRNESDAMKVRIKLEKFEYHITKVLKSLDYMQVRVCDSKLLQKQLMYADVDLGNEMRKQGFFLENMRRV